MGNLQKQDKKLSRRIEILKQKHERRPQDPGSEYDWLEGMFDVMNWGYFALENIFFGEPEGSENGGAYFRPVGTD